MLTVVTRAMKTPRCHGGCEREEQPPRQRPMRCGCRHLNASLLLYPALLTEPASGREAEHVRFTTGRFRAKAPCGTPRCGVFLSLSPAAEDGGPDGASAGSPRSCIGVPWCRARLPVRHSPSVFTSGSAVTSRATADGGIDFFILFNTLFPDSFQQQIRAYRLRPETLTPMNQCKHGSGQTLGTPPCHAGPTHNRVAPQSRVHFNADRGGSVSSRAQTQTHHLLHSISTWSGPCLRLKCGYTGMLSFPSPYGSIRADE